MRAASRDPIAGRDPGVNQPSAPGLALAPDEIHVWQVSLAAEAGRLAALSRLLSGDELGRSGRFAFDHDRSRSIIARGELRRLLAAYVDAAPAGLKFTYGPEGKPALTQTAGETPLHFNVSHSRDVAIYAVAHRPVGVDVEYAATGLAYDEIAGRFFSWAERVALSSYPAGQRHAVFFACWTLKEAYVKGRGGGLSIPLDRFDVPLGVGSEPRAVADRGVAAGATEWRVRTVEPAPGYAGALAAPGRDWHAVVRRWPR